MRTCNIPAYICITFFIQRCGSGLSIDTAGITLIGRQTVEDGILGSIEYCHGCCTSTLGGGCNTALCGSTGVTPPGKWDENV